MNFILFMYLYFQSNSFRLPSRIMKTLNIDSAASLFGRIGDSKEREELAESKRRRSLERRLKMRRCQRASSESPSRSSTKRWTTFTDIPETIACILKLKRSKSVSLERTVPMRPKRIPGPVGRTWVKMHDDIMFMDEISESEFPILGHTGYLTTVPEAEPLPKAPTPPPIRTKKKTNQDYMQNSSKRQKTDDGVDLDCKEAPEENKENEGIVHKKLTYINTNKTTRSREIYKYKTKKPKRSCTPISTYRWIQKNNELNRNGVLEDDYIIPENLKRGNLSNPIKPKRGIKMYEKIQIGIELNNTSSNEKELSQGAPGLKTSQEELNDKHKALDQLTPSKNDEKLETEPIYAKVSKILNTSGENVSQNEQSTENPCKKTTSDLHPHRPQRNVKVNKLNSSFESKFSTNFSKMPVFDTGRSTLPRLKSKNRYDTNIFAPLNGKYSSVNYQDRPLPAPPRRKRTESKLDLSHNGVEPPHQKLESSPDNSVKENGEDKHRAMNESSEFSNKIEAESDGRTKIESAGDTELENVLQNVENKVEENGNKT